MKCFMKPHLLQLAIFLVYIFLSKPISSQENEIPSSFCGEIAIKPPFLPSNPSNSCLLSRMIICKSDKLYFRTSIGLFPISSIDYENKILTVSHSPCSSTSDFVSPRQISVGFKPSSNPNSLILYNCSSQASEIFPSSPCNKNNLTIDDDCYFLSSASCLVIDDVGGLEKVSSFHPKDLNCTHYRRVFRNDGKFETGTKLSFEVDHVPNPCKECEKPFGYCGAGLRCVCHPKQCKDKVLSDTAVPLKPCGIVLIVFIILLELRVV